MLGQVFSAELGGGPPPVPEDDDEEEEEIAAVDGEGSPGSLFEALKAEITDPKRLSDSGLRHVEEVDTSRASRTEYAKDKLMADIASGRPSLKKAEGTVDRSAAAVEETASLRRQLPGNLLSSIANEDRKEAVQEATSKLAEKERGDAERAKLAATKQAAAAAAAAGGKEAEGEAEGGEEEEVEVPTLQKKSSSFFSKISLSFSSKKKKEKRKAEEEAAPPDEGK